MVELGPKNQWIRIRKFWFQKKNNSNSLFIIAFIYHYFCVSFKISVLNNCWTSARYIEEIRSTNPGGFSEPQNL